MNLRAGAQSSSVGCCPLGTPALTADGRLVVLDTPNALVTGDTNSRADVYAIRLSLDTARLVTGAGSDSGPHVRVLQRGAGLAVTSVADFFAKAEVLTGAGAGGEPHVRVWKIASDGTVSEKAGFFAYDPGFTGGVRVAAGNADLDAFAEVLTGAGPGGGPHMRVWKLTGSGVIELLGFFSYDAAFLGGVFVGGVHP